jgi:uracil-DNA glycosylase
MEWNDFLDKEKEKDYFKKLMEFVDNEYKNFKCHPDYENIFNAFKLTKLKDLKVVILGQDPYHNDNEAHGLSFSVLCKKLPPSLKNIYKEMSSDLNQEVNQDGNLTYLANEGVLLLNTILTVRHNQPLSHKNKGWEIFTDNVIKFINTIDKPIVFILWGSNARGKKKLLNNKNHLILEANHPSPLSSYRGFFGSKPFSKCNDFLISKGETPIKWIK